MFGGLSVWATARAQPVPPNLAGAPPALLEYAGRALAELIDEARQQAIADGVRPLPSGIYRSLLGYFPATLLQKTRFADGGIRPLSLPALAFTYGDAAAMTLGDVVLFKSERLAQSDLKVWAHELTHVMQYQRWGVAGFADRYVRDSAAVEQEAIDNANRFMAWMTQRPR
ncbi:eCIS core domain-containing protein [Rhodopila sp.]|uniref:eCIS core domain-containing protein n=1 Tax=Rhodopila sp. TaxID=2480087 RepID=UPI002B65FFAC|nr:DUF4157 domain-containing protein [Rhodopila sp.]HVZ07366.1 DUF4157 domain-containing protein [Rhodopila sp.]